MSSRRLSRRKLILASLVLCPLLASGQIQGPISGFVFDAVTGSLRPINGTPGAAYLGDPVLTNLEFASVAPNGKRGIAVKDGQTWYLSGLSPVSLAPVPGAIEHSKTIVWSRDSSTAVLYAPSTGQLQKIDPLGPGPVVDLSSLGAVSALALDSAGSRIAIGIDGDGGPGIYLIGPGASPSPVAGVSGKIASLTFSINGDRLYAADPRAHRILEIQDVASGGPLDSFLEDSDAIDDPVALAISADGKFLYVVNGSKNTVQSYEISTHLAISEIPLDFVPVCIEPLSEPAVFRLNVPAAHIPLLIFDTRAVATVFFVPPAAGEGTN